MAEYEVTVIGAGPIGCLMACYLSRLGIRVIIYEKRRDPRVYRDAGKSINLALSMRGLTALNNFDENIHKLLPCLGKSVPMRGRFIHLLEGETMYQPYSINPNEYLHSINRADLNNDLITLAEKKGIKIFFQHELQNIDFENKTATLVTSQGNKSIRYNVLCGTDGSNSRTRFELDRINGATDKTLKFSAGYKEFEIPAINGDKFQLSPIEAFHVWPREGGNFFIALPNIDGTWTCTMFSNTNSPDCIANLKDDQIVDYFNKLFPDLVGYIGKDKLIQDHSTNPFSGLYSVDCKNWHYKGSVVLMGDAAHGIVPYYGLGINAGFEGCRHMANLIKIYRSPTNPNWTVIFNEFQKYKEHTDVLMRASMRNAEELHSHVKDLAFLFEKEVERALQTRYPSLFIENHALLSFTNVPLSVCGKQMELQEKIIKTLCKDKNQLSQIDWKSAHILVNTELIEVFQQKMWYEYKQPTNGSKL